MEKTAKLSVRLRPRERAAIERLARKNERSMGGEVRRAIQQYLAAVEGERR